MPYDVTARVDVHCLTYPFSIMVCFVVPIYDESGLSIREIARNVARIPTREKSISSPPPPQGYQIRSPSLVLYLQLATPMEQAILLCSMFLGRKLNAFVALGHGKGHNTQWIYDGIEDCSRRMSCIVLLGV